MKSIRVVVKFKIFNQNSTCFLECEMPDIRHLTFEGVPKTLNGLIVARCTWARHAFSKTVFFNQFFGFLGSVLASSVAVVHSVRRTLRISAYCHFKSLLNNILTLMALNRPTNQTSCRNVNNTAGVNLISFANKLSYI